ncbi:MAG: biotin/lipoyl-containing protein [Acidobacteriota bacterium]
MILTLAQDGVRRPVEVRADRGRYTIVDGGESFEVDAHAVAENWWSVLLDSDSFDAHVERDGTVFRVAIAGRQFAFDLSDPARALLRGEAAPGAGTGRVVAPMPGRVMRVLAAVDEEVTRGQPVVVVEAMKMENELAAPCDGLITEIAVTEGQTVDGGALLLVVGPPAPSGAGDP